MVKNDKKEKETKEKRGHHVEETLQFKAPEEPDSSSEQTKMKMMTAFTPEEPTDVPPFKRKKSTKQQTKRAREKDESEGE